MLKPWDGGTRALDPTPGDRKERGEAERCGGPAWRPKASKAVVDYAGMRVARRKPKGQRARAHPLLNLRTRREGGRVVAPSREGMEGQGLMYPPPPSPTPAPNRLYLKIRLHLHLHALAGPLPLPYVMPLISSCGIPYHPAVAPPPPFRRGFLCLFCPLSCGFLNPFPRSGASQTFYLTHSPNSLAYNLGRQGFG